MSLRLRVLTKRKKLKTQDWKNAGHKVEQQTSHQSKQKSQAKAKARAS
jgi:hypothetical protein